MSAETRWRIIEDGTPTDEDIRFTATAEAAGYILAEITAARNERGDGDVLAVIDKGDEN